MKYCKTLKELAEHLGITYYHVRKLRDQIEAMYPSVPAYMVWGSKGYPVKAFKKRIAS